MICESKVYNSKFDSLDPTRYQESGESLACMTPSSEGKEVISSCF